MLIPPIHLCPFQFVAGYFSYKYNILIYLFKKLNFSHTFIYGLLMVQLLYNCQILNKAVK